MKLLFLLLLPLVSGAQIQPKAKTIIVKNVSFTEVCNHLLDKGYAIEKKDDQLQTVRTEHKKYPSWNAAYKIHVRVKDSTAYITGTFTAPFEGSAALYTNEPVYNDTDRKGQPRSKGVVGVAFKLINEFALSFNRPVGYSL